MAILKVTLRSGRVVEFDDAPIGRGGEKLVFFSRDRSEVICFYHGITDYAERRQRLERVINDYNPIKASNGQFWQDYFCWPTDIIEHSPNLAPFLAANGLPAVTLGLTAPAYRPNFFFRDKLPGRQLAKPLEKQCLWFTSPRLRARVPDDEFGTLQTRLLICQRVARAVRRMHAAGLAHSDLSHKNVLIDPKTGAVSIIDIDMLVVPGVAPPVVLGTKGYMAPELIAGKSTQPSRETDRHSMAVLFYEILFCRHPLDGRKIHDRKDPAHDDELKFGAKAIFVENASDTSNRPTAPITVPYTRLGKHLAELFRRAFIDGLHNPAMRPEARQWEVALNRTFDMLHPALLRGEWTVVDSTPGKPTCHHTARPLTSPVPYLQFLRMVGGKPRPEDFGLVLYDGVRLYSWHTTIHAEPNEHGARTELGYVTYHQNRWLLSNTSGHAMSVDGSGPIPHNSAVELYHDLVLRLGPTAHHRMAKVAFLGR